MKITLTLLSCTLASLSFVSWSARAADSEKSAEAKTAQNTETSNSAEPAKNAETAESSEKTVLDFLSDKLVDANGKKVSAESLKGKTVGLYFSAHWCPPCRQFTPLLVDFRDKNKAEFEVVFVSSDHSAADKKEYMTSEKMKWPSLAGVSSQEGSMLSQAFQIQGLPTLVIVTPDGTPLTPNGREHVMRDPNGALKMWQDAAKHPTS